MLERYDEQARRALFFARYEVSQRGGMTIEPEHLVLGVLRDRADTILRFARPGETADTIRKRFESAATAAARVSTSVEIPFSQSCKAALTQTGVEADALRNKTIRPEHLILGILVKTSGAAARALREAGVDPNAIREALRGTADDSQERPAFGRVMSVHRSPAGVARQWKGVVKPGMEGEYIRHLRGETLPALRRLAGFDTVTIMRRDVEGGVEFQVTTYWRSLDAIKAFAGDDITRAVVPPAARALMVRYDERAMHYDIVE